MKLELKHLAPYLPYGLKYAFKCVYDADNDTEGELTFDTSDFGGVLYEVINNSEYLPILRPLSDLTEEYLKELSNIEDASVQFTLEDNEFMLYVPYEGNVCYSTYVKLFEWHFDVFGLIDKGLAIDINTLEK